MALLHDLVLSVAGGFDDHIEGNEGRDLVFGDHAAIALSEIEPYKLVTAITTDAHCTPGVDNITLGEGDDMAFGGAAGDYIEGGNGDDVIFGDFGQFDARIEVLPNRYFASLVDFSAYGGADLIHGEAGDDLIVGGEDNDVLFGGVGSDDLIGGHNTRWGIPGNDTIYGDEDDDVILGDNGDILREVASVKTEFPWTSYVWATYHSPFDSEKIRDYAIRYDDVDGLGGNDKIYGGPGNDVLHGQRGDDTIWGEDGNDELFGELGDDYLYGGAGDDILLGDVGYVSNVDMLKRNLQRFLFPLLTSIILLHSLPRPFGGTLKASRFPRTASRMCGTRTLFWKSSEVSPRLLAFRKRSTLMLLRLR